MLSTDNNSGDKVYYMAMSASLGTIVLVFALTVAAIVFRKPSDQELDRAFLAGMEAGNQTCSVLVPERQRRRPLAQSGGLL